MKEIPEKRPERNMEETHITAHRESIRHRKQIFNSDICGCFYCLKIFKPTEITDWCDYEALETGGEKVGQTALCPYCSIDAVIGSASGYPITKEFLKKMSTHWF